MSGYLMRLRIEAGDMSRQDEIGRAYWLMWGFGAVVTREWRQAATDGLGHDFSGRLLEVPVGTDVLTLPLYP
jgi:hypothetical protein